MIKAAVSAKSPAQSSLVTGASNTSVSTVPLVSTVALNNAGGSGNGDAAGNGPYGSIKTVPALTGTAKIKLARARRRSFFN